MEEIKNWLVAVIMPVHNTEDTNQHIQKQSVVLKHAMDKIIKRKLILSYRNVQRI